MTEQDDVLVARSGSAGLLTLNRPKALNALTHGMVRTIAEALGGWENDPAVSRVIVRGAGDRAFCAGGDIRVVHDLGLAGRQGEALQFWRDEYVMNRQIKRYPKPYIAMVDGIVMGGGVGVSIHGSHRVAGERFSFAMPEVGIGFFPDVGATYALPRLPHHAGVYLALTGARIGRTDAIALGIASHAVASADFQTVTDRLGAGDDIDSVLASHAVDPGPSPLSAQFDLIERVFKGDNVAAIMTALGAEPGAFAAATLATMKAKSPFSMALALEQMKRGATLTFDEAMRLEMRIVSRIVHGHEFYEGVRAAIIDKDQAPRWKPDRIEDVDMAKVQAFFEPIANELAFT